MFPRLIKSRAVLHVRKEYVRHHITSVQNEHANLVYPTSALYQMGPLRLSTRPGLRRPTKVRITDSPRSVEEASTSVMASKESPHQTTFRVLSKLKRSKIVEHLS